MTRPMPTGCIKEHPSPSWLKFNLLLETVSLGDPIFLLLILKSMNKMRQKNNFCIMKSLHQ